MKTIFTKEEVTQALVAGAMATDVSGGRDPWIGLQVASTSLSVPWSQVRASASEIRGRPMIDAQVVNRRED
jgi:hypothetical protein